MLTRPEQTAFAPINRAFAETFRPARLSVGLVVPVESYPDCRVPAMARHLERVQLAERLGFSAVWVRDVPFDVPAFGDAGQIFDPFVYLGALAATTGRIALGVASVVLPLRHPAHVAKAAASVDRLSGGRLLLGVASGDRPEEYPAMGLDHATRGARFRAGVDYIRRMADPFPAFEGPMGAPDGRADMLPKPVGGRLPLLITGGAQQGPDWGAMNGDGWMTYPRPVSEQARVVADWRGRADRPKPVMQPLYLDLAEDPDTPPAPIHLGLRTGSQALVRHLAELQDAGINHVALNLRFNRTDIETTLKRLADDVLPHFQGA